jgi:hypothetical protein
MAAVDAWIKSHEDMDRAIEILRQRVPSYRTKDKHVAKDFILYQLEKIHIHLSVGNQFKGRTPSNPQIVLDGVALACAEALKQGYSETHTFTFCHPKTKRVSEETREVRQYYTSINAACLKIEELHDACVRYKVEPKHLLRRMHEVDKTLCIRRRTFKRALSEEQRQARIMAAKQHLERYYKEGMEYVCSIIFTDEFSMWMVPTSASSAVYCDAHDQGVHVVVPLQTVRKAERVKLHILVSVNCILGAFYMEFTTGTTDIHRIHFEPPVPYKVSGSTHDQPPWLRCTRQLPPMACRNLLM